MDLRILIIAEDPITRAGLATLLDREENCTVAGQIAGLDELPTAFDVYRPDVLVWDMGWDPTNAIDRLAELMAEDEEAQTLRVVSLLPDAENTADVWNAGARGLMLRNAEADDIAAALAAVARGLTVFDPTLAPVILPAENVMAAPVEALTPRELDVLQLLAEGLSNKAIAQRLEISAHTVKFHVNAIMGKLDARSRTEAVVHAMRLGVIIL